MLLHVDNLRRSYEREHTELEETKRVLIEHKLLVVSVQLLILRNNIIAWVGVLGICVDIDLAKDYDSQKLENNRFLN